MSVGARLDSVGRFRFHLLLAVGACLVAGSLALPSFASANACDPGEPEKTWDGSASNDWFDAANWTPQTVNPPSSTQDVCIEDVSPNPAPVIGAAEATARTIHSDLPIDVLTGGTLHLFNGTLQSFLDGGITLEDSSTLNTAGPLIVRGASVWNNGATIKGATGAAKKITIADGATLTAPDGTFSERYLDTGTLRISGTATLAGNDGGSYWNTALKNGGDIELSETGTLDLQDGQTVYDSDGGGDSIIHTLLGGTLTRTNADAGGADVALPVENDGTVTATSGKTLTLSGGSSASTGAWAPAAGGFINFTTSGNVHSVGGSSIGGAGTVFGNFTVAAAQTFTVNGNYRWDAGTTIAGAGTAKIAAGGTLVAPTGDFSERYLDTGTLRIEGTATLEGNGGGSYFQTALQNGADIDVVSGDSLRLQNEQAVYDIDGGGDSLVHVLAGGKLTKTASSAGVADVQAPVDNDGTVTTTAGILTLSGGSGGQASTGQYSPGAASLVDLSGGTHLLGNGATIAGPGTVSVSGTGVLTTADAASAASVVSGGTLSLTASGTLSSGAGSVTSHGTVFWDNGSTIGAGTTTIASDGTLIAPAGAFSERYVDTGTLRIEGTATLEGNDGGSYWNTALKNGGDIEVGGASGARTLDLQDSQAIYDLDGGGDSIIHVLSGGTLTRTDADVGTGADVQVPVENDGTVTATSGKTLTLSGGSSASTGDWAPAAGGFVDFTTDADVHSVGGSSIDGAGTVFGNFTVAGAQTFDINGNYRWDNATTIAGAGTTKVTSGGTLVAPTADFSERYLDTGTLRIEGTATLEGNDGGSYWNTALRNDADIDVVSGDSLRLQNQQIVYDIDGGGDSSIHVLSGGKLSRTVAVGTAADVQAPVDNDGTIEISAGLLALSGGFTNYNQATDVLTGGAYVVRNGALLQFAGADVKTNAADITLDGVGSGFQDETAADGFRNLATNNAPGKLRLRNGRDFARTGGFTNNGLIDLDDSTMFTTTGSYTQGAGGTLATDIAGTVAGASYGWLDAGTTANVNGTLDVDVSAYPPAHNDVFDVVTAGTTRTGTFTTIVGNGFDVVHLADRVRVTPPTLTIANRTVTEGNTGTLNAAFTVTLSSPSAATVEVDYATADDTATQPGDYTATSGTLSFAPGQVTRTINVPVKGDTIDENNERFDVNLDASDPRFANVADATGVGTITDNDPPPTVSISDSPNRSEGDAASSFDVTLSAASEKEVKVNYATVPGSPPNGATSPADYTAKSGTLTFAPNDTTEPVTVSSVEDALDENDETFTVDLSTPVAATLGDASGSATITDDDSLPSVSINNSPNRQEGGPASSFTVTLSAPSGRQVTVNYASTPGAPPNGATSPADYTAISGTLTFAPGETTKPLSVSSVDDALDENAETFTVDLTVGSNVATGDMSGSAAITDNDPPPAISVADSVNRSEGGPASGFQVTLSAPSGRVVTVEYETQNLTAVAPGDYIHKSSLETPPPLTFNPGQTSKIVQVNSVEDAVPEPPPSEKFRLLLSLPTGASLADRIGIARIIDDD